jgi:hypothetical protein
MSKPVIIARAEAAERLALLVNALRRGEIESDGALIHVPDRVRFDLAVDSDTIALSVGWAELQAGAPKRDKEPLDDRLVEEADDEAAAHVAESVDDEDAAAAIDARTDRVPVP